MKGVFAMNALEIDYFHMIKEAAVMFVRLEPVQIIKINA